MKRILYLSITHKYILLVFFGALLLVKFMLEKIGIPASLQQTADVVTNFLYWIYAAAMINLIIFLLAVLITGNRKEEWWEKTNTSTDNTKEKLLGFWVKSLVVTIPVALYGSLFYVILQSDWGSIGILVAIIAIAYLVNMKKKKTVSNTENISQ